MIKNYKCDDFVGKYCFTKSCPLERDLVQNCRECWLNLDDCSFCDNWDCPANEGYTRPEGEED